MTSARRPERSCPVQTAAILALALLAAAAVVPLVSASSGDRDPLFGSCLARCQSNACQGRPQALSTNAVLRLTLWSCADNCKYECMHQRTDELAALGISPHQYYGKWPFYRLMGLQEPASVLFSLLNLHGHLVGFRRLRRLVPSYYPLRSLVLLNSFLGINLWVWSSIFHSRDFPITEKLDYYSAMASFFCNLALTAILCFNIRSRIVQRWIVSVLAAGYLGHITYLTLRTPFDYRFNTIVGVVVGVANNVILLLWGILNWTRRASYARHVVLMVCIITGAMTLEIFDFAPILGVLDAHSLWHASTIPVVWLWYHFIDHHIAAADASPLKR
ncbi:Per1-like-domain-containing protein [Polychytrium aggregatum]|uniref:Per1-like-domain-containing protein n=1 Tax=Polychytrium aggregatum TaxID=110093 RepID=UPI0022FDCAB1|nr:Per1-like-domain-containing protein [Polychytrium aggregatum]KAI9199847.1 Per1-like-domain-containing protein [Polychytrium aggregatum]